jgi:signal transduction histidine kinase
MQRGTDAILSVASDSLTRLINLTLIATVVAALGLLGYARWLSGRISKLSDAAERAIGDEGIRSVLPSALASDEIGDLSRSFSSVLQQLGDYNAYLRTLASKLSHELRTPLTIITSSLENLEHEALDEDAANYTARARDGARRLQKILSAMSEANRVEELMESIELERFDLHRALESTVAAYADAWPGREFAYTCDCGDLSLDGSPELIIQMLDKLVDNAVDFTQEGDTIDISLASDAGVAVLAVSNPGPPLPDRMRGQLFDSMISIRNRGNEEHLGLGLYIARLIAAGHRGTISADNAAAGVTFEIRLPVSRSS